MSLIFPAFIGLGANLGDAPATLRSAVADLRQLPGSRVSSVSSLYRSAPVGPAGQPDYFNAAVRMETSLTPHALLTALQAIENRHGRVREIRWGARTLDLDLLLYGSDEITTDDLIIPHAELTRRNFVVIPLLDLLPPPMLPDGSALTALPTARDRSGLSIAQADTHWAD